MKELRRLTRWIGLSLLLGAGCASPCRWIPGSCLELEVQGLAEPTLLSVRLLTEGVSWPVTTLKQAVDGSVPLVVQPPPHVTASAVRAVQVEEVGGDPLLYLKGSTPLFWPDDAHIQAAVLLQPVSPSPPGAPEPMSPAAPPLLRFERSELQLAGPVSGLLISGDLYGNKRRDLAVFNTRQNLISLLFNQGDGSFREPSGISLSYPVQALASVEWNNDAYPDLVAFTPGGPGLAFLFTGGRLGGKYTSSATPLVTDLDLVPAAVTGADLNQDGKSELVIANARSGGEVLVLQRDMAPFSQRVVSQGKAPAWLHATDLDGDGFQDILVGHREGGGVRLLRNSMGSLVPGPRLAECMVPSAPVVLHRQKSLAVFVACESDNEVHVIVPAAAGTFRIHASIPLPEPYALLSLDVDQDGQLDVIALPRSGSAQALLVNEDFSVRLISLRDSLVTHNLRAAIAEDLDGGAPQDIAFVEAGARVSDPGRLVVLLSRNK